MKKFILIVMLVVLFTGWESAPKTEKVGPAEKVEITTEIIDGVEVEKPLDISDIEMLPFDFERLNNQQILAIKNAVRYLSENEKIYLAYSLSSDQNFDSFVGPLSGFMTMNDTQFVLTDYFIKANKDGNLMRFNKYISYDKTQVSNSTSFYPAQKDWDYGYFSRTITLTESAYDGSGIYNDAHTIQHQYDYIIKYNFLKERPEELQPLFDIAKFVASRVDYDWITLNGTSKGVHKGQKAAICDGYADYAIGILEANLDKLPGLTAIYKVNSSKANHAWNELIYNGKTVYFDTTWFDTSKIGEDGYTMELPEEFDYKYVTYDKEIFDHGYSGKQFVHYSHGDAVKTLAWSK